MSLVVVVLVSRLCVELDTLPEVAPAGRSAELMLPDEVLDGLLELMLPEVVPDVAPMELFGRFASLPSVPGAAAVSFGERGGGVSAADTASAALPSIAATAIAMLFDDFIMKLLYEWIDSDTCWSALTMVQALCPAGPPWSGAKSSIKAALTGSHESRGNAAGSTEEFLRRKRPCAVY